MALTDENGNGGMIMPVAPMGYGYGNNGFGFGGGDWGSWIILFLIFGMFGMGGWGGGGFGGGFGFDFPWLLSGQNGINANTDAAINQLSTQNALGNLSTAIASGFGDVQLGIAGVNQNICQTGNSIVSAVNNAQNATAQQLYNNEIASLNRSFAEQTANTAGFSGVQSKLADCCCENRLATQGLQTTIAQDGAATRQTIAQGIQSIQDKLCQLELDGVKSDLTAAQRENAALQNQLNMAAFRADNTAQTAAIEASQNAQTQYIVNRVAPYPIPAYPVANPYGCGGYNYGYGYNGGFNPFGNVGFGNGSF